MVFVDSSFWIALASRRDAHHGEAVELLAPVRFDRGEATVAYSIVW